MNRLCSPKFRQERIDSFHKLRTQTPKHLKKSKRHVNYIIPIFKSGNFCWICKRNKALPLTHPVEMMENMKGKKTKINHNPHLTNLNILLYFLSFFQVYACVCVCLFKTQTLSYYNEPGIVVNLKFLAKLNFKFFLWKGKENF